MHSNKSSSINLGNGLTINRLVSLSTYATWRVGGSAEWFSEPTSIDELKALIIWSKEEKLSCKILGAGSNLLVSDAGVKGLTICLKKLNGYNINQENGEIEAFSGENIPALARRAAKAGLHGLEWAVGIPGTIGGGAVMNAGAQGGSFSDCIESVKVLPINGNKEFDISNIDLDYSYRKSRLQKNDLIVISTKLKLEAGHDPKKILFETNSNLHHRTKTQPYELPSCGSVFRNPNPYKAGKLIEELGLKGLAIGGAEISKLHANFIVNKGNATAQDIEDLITVVQTKIKEAYGLELHPEVKKVGYETNN